jgi:radical SAM superfamily enzyme YgiQ (UPF0313 family)
MQYSIEFIGKKASMPSLSLLTIAGMFPDSYNLKIVDMNVEPLRDSHLKWADIVFTSTMIVQKDSLNDVIRRCNNAGIPIIAGGPHPTSFHEDIYGVDYLVMGEVEESFDELLQTMSMEDFSGKGNFNYSHLKPDITKTPVPRYDLVKFANYESMSLQFSRGCPFNCEFCDITKLYGRNPRTKSNKQMLAEFQMLYDLGWRGPVFLVDDNFIGNRRDTMRLLPDLVKWQKERNYPFDLYTEASVNLANYDDMLALMVESNFFMVFLGIETPDYNALVTTKKTQNVKKNEDDFLMKAVRKIQGHGIQVSAGFILGLDGDSENAFENQIAFIQEAGIPLAMVGLLGALKGTDLYQRLLNEGRLIHETDGNNVGLQLNFIPEMDTTKLLEGYKHVLGTIYDKKLKNYFDRCLNMFDAMGDYRSRVRIGKAEMMAMWKSFTRQIFSPQGPAYIQFMSRVMKKYPRLLPDAVRLAIIGYHCSKITHDLILKG